MSTYRLFPCLPVCLFALIVVPSVSLSQDLYVGGTSGIAEYTAFGGFVRTFATPGGNYENFRFGPDGNLYVAQNNLIAKYSGNTGAFLGNVITGLTSTQDLVFDGSGNLYAPEGGSVNDVKKISPSTGVILQTYLGTNGTQTGLGNPRGLTFRSNGDLLVGNNTGLGANLTEFNTATGTSSVFATGFASVVGVSSGADGRYYATNQNGEVISVVGPNGGTATTFSSGGSLNNPEYSTFLNGNLFVTSLTNNTVQQFDGTTGAFLSSFPVTGAFGITTGPVFTSAATPEPGSLALFVGMGLSGGIFLKRRKRVSLSL